MNDLLHRDLKWVFSHLIITRIPRNKTHIYLTRLLIEFAYLKEIQSIESVKNVYTIIGLTKLHPRIPYFVRGSANSSILCYLLGISHIDSIKYRVVLARFLNHTRKDLPDIDMDFPSFRRDEMFRRINERFHGRVARISNKVYFREKSSMRQAIRNIGIHRFIGKDEDLFSCVSRDVRKTVRKEAYRLMDTINYYSLHCGGILIYPNHIPNDIILHPNKRKKIRDDIIPQVIYDKYDVDKKNLFKIDILSNHAFTTLLHIDGRDLTEYPEQDEKTATMLADSVIGITLAESSLIGFLCRKYRPKSRYQLALVLSLARPASSNTRRLYKDDLELLEKDDIIIFDDDAIEYISHILQISHDESDKWRKIFAKNDKENIIKFKKLLMRRGFSKRKIKTIVGKLKTLRQYGFCKGHALAFAHLVWGLTYCKANYPKRFWVSTLNHSNTEWRPWVHYRSAIVEGKLSLELGEMHRNWKLRGDKLVKKYSFGRQSKLDEYFSMNRMDSMDAYYECGYWNEKDFLDDMYLEIEEEDNIQKIEFRGLIGRIKWGSNSEYITIGYDNGKYIDLCINKYSETDLRGDKLIYDRFDFIEGWGERTIKSAKYNKHIKVKWYTMW